MAVAQAELRLEIAHFQQNLKKAMSDVRKFSSSMGKGGGAREGGRAMGSSMLKGLTSVMLAGVAGVTAGVTGALTSALISGIGSAVRAGVSAFTRAGMAGARSFMSGFKSAIEDERLNISFSTFIGNESGGLAMVKELRKQSLATGVELESITGIMKKLMAMDFSASDALNLQKNILDVAGLSGMNSRDTALFGVALSQVAAKGVANMEELRQQIAEKGVPIFDALTKKLGVTKGVLFDMIKQGKVSSETVLDIFRNLEGPMAKFKGGAAKLAKTTGGVIARMKLEFVDLMRVMAEPVREAITPSLERIRQKLAGAKEWGRGLGESLKEGAQKILASFEVLSTMDWGAIGGLISAHISKAFNDIATDLVYKMTIAGEVLRGYWTDISAKMSTVWENLKEAAWIDSIALKLEKMTNDIMIKLWALEAKVKAWVIEATTIKVSGKGGEEFINTGIGNDVNYRTMLDSFKKIVDLRKENEAIDLKLAHNKKTDAQANMDVRQTGKNYYLSDRIFMSISKLEKLGGEYGALLRSGLNKRLSSESEDRTIKTFTDKVAKIMSELKGAAGGGAGGAAGVAGTTASAKAAMAGTPFITGGIQAGVNTVLGKSAFNVVADHAAKQTALEEKIEKNTREMLAWIKKPYKPGSSKNVGQAVFTEAQIIHSGLGMLF